MFVPWTRTQLGRRWSRVAAPTVWNTLQRLLVEWVSVVIAAINRGPRPPSATVVSAEPFSHETGTLQCLQKEIATYRHWSVFLWRDPDDVPHCWILSPDKTEWRLISATLCRWRRCFVADQLWFMTQHAYEKQKKKIEVLLLHEGMWHLCRCARHPSVEATPAS